MAQWPELHFLSLWVLFFLFLSFRITALDLNWCFLLRLNYCLMLNLFFWWYFIYSSLLALHVSLSFSPGIHLRWPLLNLVGFNSSHLRHQVTHHIIIISVRDFSSEMLGKTYSATRGSTFSSSTCEGEIVALQVQKFPALGPTKRFRSIIGIGLKRLKFFNTLILFF